jgi:hypothetical protein
VLCNHVTARGSSRTLGLRVHETDVHDPRKLKIVLTSVVCGVILTVALTVMAFRGDSRAWGCTFVWQACLLQTVIHTPDNPVHEGSPIDLLAFALGIALGVPIYSALSYLALSHWDKNKDAI